MDGPAECIQLEGLNDILCMAWKQDNQGPHDVHEASSPELPSQLPRSYLIALHACKCSDIQRSTVASARWATGGAAWPDTEG